MVNHLYEQRKSNSIQQPLISKSDQILIQHIIKEKIQVELLKKKRRLLLELLYTRKMQGEKEPQKRIPSNKIKR